MPDIDSILQKYPFVQSDSLIPILGEIQDNFGFLPPEAIQKVGDYLKIPTSRIYGLATFYSKFRFQSKGKYHIRICNGTSCHINLNTIVLKELYKILGIKDGEVTKNGLFSLERTGCMSGCGSGPVMVINDKIYSHLNIEKVQEIIHFYMQIENQ